MLALLLASNAFPQTETSPQTDTRDALIEELRRRIELLEKRFDEKPAPPPPAAAPAPAPKPAASEEAGREDEGARALERTLVRTGGLVLPKGAFELEPRLQYSYRGSQGLGIVAVGGFVGQQDISRNQFEASLGLRAGLPWSMQAEVRVPYIWAHEDRATSSAARESERISGLGDIDLGLSKQFLDERGRRPALLGAVNWKSTTGQHELGRLSAGSGFPQLQASLTAVKREDPLVFFGAASYTRVFERERSGADIDPGDAVGLKVGSLLAASPETSLRAAFDFTRSSRTRIAGSSIAGSDATVGVLELGLATLLTSRTLLDLELGIGLTPDAPDFRVRLALPIRF